MKASEIYELLQNQLIDLALDHFEEKITEEEATIKFQNLLNETKQQLNNAT